ncbi:ABC transporter ATP-binding protein [Nonomuraea turcica]|uniref:ABC transporter ATP-binding protein n=1 Tax=Nonomuraea sp. G32 TaxID=3067274 RepID=UPI00273ABBB8|nr:ABC transporter ATP-binding protein [Nonomuraea sp. G32]MDP4502364.1 ABC transporter ATP-binding protein [Nonomuraea sp. G32]
MPMNDLAVVFDNVVKRYDRLAAMDGITLSIESGEIFGLLGPNGAGKTTSIETLVGLRRPTSGRVLVYGYDPIAQRDEIRRLVAVQPQHAALFEQQTVAELLRVWASFYPDPADPDDVIGRLGLGDSRDVRVSKLSGGQQQRLLVGTALISRPRLLVLDEPSTGMDPNARQDLWEAVRGHRDSGGTVLLSTHSMEEAETLCGRVAILHSGKVVALGAPDELIRQHAPDQELRFTVASGTALGELESRSDVSELSAQEQNGHTRVSLRTSDPDSLFTVLTTRLGARQIQTRDAGLEAVFRRVTGASFADIHGEG